MKLTDAEIKRLEKIQIMIHFCGYGGHSANSRGANGDAKLIQKIIDQQKQMAGKAVQS